MTYFPFKKICFLLGVLVLILNIIPISIIADVNKIAAVSDGSREIPTIAIVDFDASSTRYSKLGRQTAELMTDAVANAGLFDVVEREKLTSILKEQGFSGSGMVDINSAIAMGEMLGAQYLLTGKIISAGVSKKTFSGYGVKTTKATTSIKISARVLDTRTGKIAFSGTESAASSSQSTNYLNVGSPSFAGLAERASNKLVSRIVASKKFSPKEIEKVVLVKVQFNSTPELADVEVDGVFYGNTGDILEIPSGMHLVRISLSGYDVWEKKVLIRGGMNIHASLQKSADIKILHQSE